MLDGGFLLVVVADDGQPAAEFGAEFLNGAGVVGERCCRHRDSFAMRMLRSAVTAECVMRPTEMKSGLRTVLTVAYAGWCRGKRPAISVRGGGDHFQRFGEHIGRHVVEHDAVDPAGDGLADFVVVAAFHFNGRARIVTPAQQFDGLGH